MPEICLEWTDTHCSTVQAYFQSNDMIVDFTKLEDTFQCKVSVPPGEQLFYFIVDGEICIEPEYHRTVVNGTEYNMVLENNTSLHRKKKKHKLKDKVALLEMQLVDAQRNLKMHTESNEEITKNEAKRVEQLWAQERTKWKSRYDQMKARMEQAETRNTKYDQDFNLKLENYRTAKQSFELEKLEFQKQKSDSNDSSARHNDEKINAENVALTRQLEKSEKEYQLASEEWMKERAELLAQGNAARERGDAMDQSLLSLKQNTEGMKLSMNLLKESCQNTFKDAFESCQDIAKQLVAKQGEENQELQNLKVKYKKEMSERRKYYNLVQQLKGNIRVYCRVRPEPDQQSNAIQISGDQITLSHGIESVDKARQSVQQYEFDRIFDQESSQADVFQDVRPLITSVMDGYNITMMAYGQTGSGKTHTSFGDIETNNNEELSEGRGVYIRALEKLFEIQESRANDYEYEISLSMFEIYNETIRDLLCTSKDSGTNLEIRMQKTGQVSIPGLQEQPVQCIADVIKQLVKGSSHRSVGVTDMNAHSSRSHSVLSIHVKGYNTTAELRYNGKMHLVDLAGSERIAKSNVVGARLKEAQAINKSLSSLGDVIQALVTKQKHIPFRNSKLTYFLSDSLGGNSAMLMLLCIRSADENTNETSCSLKFGARAQSVELGVAKQNTSHVISPRRQPEATFEKSPSRSAMTKSRPTSSTITSPKQTIFRAMSPTKHA